MVGFLCVWKKNFLIFSASATAGRLIAKALLHMKLVKCVKPSQQLHFTKRFRYLVCGVRGVLIKFSNVSVK